MEWYSDYPHLGYDLDGKKIIKPVQGDQVGVVSDLFPFQDYLDLKIHVLSS